MTLTVGNQHYLIEGHSKWICIKPHCKGPSHVYVSCGH